MNAARSDNNGVRSTAFEGYWERGFTVRPAVMAYPVAVNGSFEAVEGLDAGNARFFQKKAGARARNATMAVVLGSGPDPFSANPEVLFRVQPTARAYDPRPLASPPHAERSIGNSTSDESSQPATIHP